MAILKTLRLHFVVLAALTIALLALTACGEAAQPDATAAPAATTAPEAAPAATSVPAATAAPTAMPDTPSSDGEPVYGGTLMASAAAGYPSTWEVHAAVYLEDIQIIGPMYLQLLEYNPLVQDAYTEGAILGDLAERWEASDGGLTYTFYMRPGVKWSDGMDITVDDVVWSFNNIIVPGAPRPATGKLRQYIESVEKVDDSTVRMRLLYPSAAFISFMAVEYMKVLPKHIFDTEIDKTDFASHTVGAGPFLAVDDEFGVSSKFEKNDTYWREGRPFFDGYQSFYITDKGTEIAAYQTEQVFTSMDSINHLDVEDSIRLEADAEFMSKHDIFWMDGAAAFHWVLNTEKPPFDDANLRKAVHLLVDRWEMVDGFGLGKFRVGAVYAPNNPFAIPESEIEGYPGFKRLPDGSKDPDDIAEGVKLLAEAGYGPDNRLTVDFVALNIFFWADGVQVLKEQLKPYGIDIDIRLVDYAAGVHEAEAGTFEAATLGRANMIPDPDDSFPSAYLPGSKNWARWTDPRITDLWNQQSREADEDKRRELNYEIQRIIYSEANSGYVEYMWNAFTQMVNKRIKTYDGDSGTVGPFVPHFSLYTSLKHWHEFLDDDY